MNEEQINELIEYNLEYFNEALTDEQIANSMLDKVELEAKLQEKDKEIERLNNKLNAIRKYLKDNEQEYGSLEDNEKIVLGIIEGNDNER